jgi:glycosyltransferase involved in cell wall biosynthesis
MKNHPPMLSIGLPVYNGAQFIEEALDSILAQTLEDFELIISDNASTDGTDKICRDYAAKDSRIRYYRSEQNLGAAWNFNRVFELSLGKYFKWAAHDDVLAPNFLLKCVEILEQNSNVVLCHSYTKIIDKDGQVLHNYQANLNTNAPNPRERFHALLGRHLNIQIFGLIRTSALKMKPLMGNYSYADEILLLKLALLGRFYEIPEYLFSYRKHAQQSMSQFTPDLLIYASGNSKQPTERLPDHHAYTIWFDPANEGQIFFPHWRIAQECLNSVWEAPLSWYERICCYLSVLARWRGLEFLLLKDLLEVVKQLGDNSSKIFALQEQRSIGTQGETGIDKGLREL